MNKLAGWTLRVVVGTAAVAALVGVSAVGAQAQKKAQGKAPAKAQSAWVKLCEDAKVPKPGKDGKTEAVTRKLCLTHHEQINPNNGRVLVSAAIRVIEGVEKPHLMVMVPLGVAIPPGVTVAVYNKDQWERVKKKEKVDKKELKPLALKFSSCHEAGCTAETVAPPELIKSMETGATLMVLAFSATGRQVYLPVPLVGFAKTHKGGPYDAKKYSQIRAKMMASIYARMQERIKDRQARAAAAAKTPKPKPIKK